MSTEPETPDLPVEPVFYCPGEFSPVSLAVHRARQAADWPGCRDCPSQDTPSGVLSPDPRTRIRVTEFGVRGVWQNSLSRQEAAQLISVVTGYLLTRQSDRPTNPRADHQDASVDDGSNQTLTLVMGYDGRPSSPDIYAGAVSAALQNGCDVIDAGRATTAQLQELCRASHIADGVIIVTGAGEAPSLTGFDVFDRRGQSVSVPWQARGIELRRQTLTAPTSSHPEECDGRDALARLQHSMTRDEMSRYPEHSVHASSEASAPLLTLPGQSTGAMAGFRVSRRSGVCHTVEAESEYRRWLSHWFPDALPAPPACLCSDPLTAERLFLLLEKTGVTADVLPIASTRPAAEQLSQRVRETHAPWGFSISEDDRFLTVANQYGQCLTAVQLSRWINDAVHATRSHITTHVPAGEERVVMLDAARPHHAASHEVIADALATVGCLSRIIASGIRLPRLS